MPRVKNLYRYRTLAALLRALLPRRRCFTGEVTEIAARLGMAVSHMTNLRRGRRRLAHVYVHPLWHGLGLDRAQADFADLVWQLSWAPPGERRSALEARVEAYAADPPAWLDDPDHPLVAGSAALRPGELALPDLMGHLRRVLDSHPQPPPWSGFVWAAASPQRWVEPLGPPAPRLALDAADPACWAALRQALAVARFAQWTRPRAERRLRFGAAAVSAEALSALCAVGEGGLPRLWDYLEAEPPPAEVPCVLVAIGVEVLVLGQAAPAGPGSREGPEDAQRPASTDAPTLPGLLTAPDYRTALAAWHRERQVKYPGFTRSALARKVGCSAGHLCNVLCCTRHLRPEHTARLAQIIGLTVLETEGLNLRVEIARTHDPVRRAMLQERLRGLLNETASQGTSAGYHQGILSALHAGVHELAVSTRFQADGAWIAASLGGTAAAAQAALDDLVQAGLLAPGPAGGLVPTHAVLTTEPEFTAYTAARVSDQMLHAAQVAIPSSTARRLHRLLVGWVRLDRLDGLRAEAVGLHRGFHGCAARHADQPRRDTVATWLVQVLPLSWAWPGPPPPPPEEDDGP